MKKYQDKTASDAGTPLNAATFLDIQKNNGIRLYNGKLTSGGIVALAKLLQSDYLGIGDCILDTAGQIGKVTSINENAGTMTVDLTGMELAPDLSKSDVVNNTATAANNAVNLINAIESRANSGEFNGRDAAVVEADGKYAFQIRDGHLILTYSGNTAPNFEIVEGKLIYTF